MHDEELDGLIRAAYQEAAARIPEPRPPEPRRGPLRVGAFLAAAAAGFLGILLTLQARPGPAGTVFARALVQADYHEQLDAAWTRIRSTLGHGPGLIK